MSENNKRKIKIPDNLVNLIDIVAGLVTICTPIVGYFSIKTSIQEEKFAYVGFQAAIAVFIGSLFCIVLMFLKLRKYRKILQDVKKHTSEKYYDFLHDCRNMYFELQKEYKNGSLGIGHLSEKVEVYLVNALDYLCAILEAFTKHEISGCIKLIEAPETSNGEIDVDKAVVYTFARSKNTDIRRKDNDINNGKKDYVKDNTDFYAILGPDRDSNKSYFYKRNLLKYNEELKKQDRLYRNTTEKWYKFYRGTIVVPIRVANKRLFFKKQDDKYNIIGFLCVDSMSTDAFLENQEKFNCFLVKAFAAEIYIILNQYKFYLDKLTTQQEEGEVK